MSHRVISGLIGAVALLLVTSSAITLAAEGAEESSGTVIEVNGVTHEYTIRDRDGKTYVVKQSEIVATDPKTGEAVLYEMVDGAPAHVRVASSGTVVEMNAAAGEYTVKDRDGKTYVIKKKDVVAQDLKTGDAVVYEIVEGAPANVMKPKA
jgi:hypothetical protein